jgi:hypothetical protein
MHDDKNELDAHLYLQYSTYDGVKSSGGKWFWNVQLYRELRTPESNSGLRHVAASRL